MRKVITPENKEHWLNLRLSVITSTEVSALFGLNPYITEFELWHQKKNQTIVNFEENERMLWGNRLEESIAKGIAEDKGWKIKEYKDFIMLEECKIGSSFDYIVDDSAILEIKNVDSLMFKDKWIIEDGVVIEAPTHIEFQIQHQMLSSGLNKGYIGALIGGNEKAILEREIDYDITTEIVDKVGNFWDSIESNEPPTPNYERDAEFLASIHNKVNPDTIIDATSIIEDLAVRYKKAADEEKLAVGKKKAAKAELLTIIGEASRVNGEEFSITSKEVKASKVESFVKKPFRSFRVNWKKK